MAAVQMTVRKRYEAMRDALNATGIPILFSMCEWGVSSPWEYGHEVPHLPNMLAVPICIYTWRIEISAALAADHPATAFMLD